MKRMIDSDKIKVNNNGEVEINASTKFNEDIDASGVNLTIDDITLPEDGNQSVKKIYCHPISTRFTRGSVLSAQFSCLIFDNNPEPYTWATFVEKVASISENNREAVIMASGYVYNNDAPTQSIVISHLSYNTENPAITCEGVKDNNGDANYYTMQTEYLTFAYFSDGVNAIN